MAPFLAALPCLFQLVTIRGSLVYLASGYNPIHPRESHWVLWISFQIVMEQQGGNCFPQDVSTIQESPDAFWKVCFKIIAGSRMLRYLLQWLHKGCSWLHCLFSVGAVDNHRQPRRSPKRTVWHAKKNLAVVARILFAFIPSRLQVALGFLNTVCRNVVLEGQIAVWVANLCDAIKTCILYYLKSSRCLKQALDKTLKSPVRPYRKGNKRKKEDLFLEEQQCWIETLLKEFPDDDPEDLTYEPTKSEIDSEENRSQNDTAIDLEYEEKDDLLMLKEDPISLQGQDGEDGAAETPQAGDTLEGPAALRTTGDGRELPEQCLLTSNSSCSRKSFESTETVVTSIEGSDTDDSQEHWTEASCSE